MATSSCLRGRRWKNTTCAHPCRIVTRVESCPDEAKTCTRTRLYRLERHDSIMYDIQTEAVYETATLLQASLMCKEEG